MSTEDSNLVKKIFNVFNKSGSGYMSSEEFIDGMLTIKSTDLKDGQKLKTVQGEELTIHYKDNKWMVHDAKGGMANITIADVISSNGVTYVIDAVLMPKK